MEIDYYYKDNYYINDIYIRNIFKDSSLSDFEKYNAIILLTYYLIYNQFSFETLKKNIKKYNIELIEIKLLDNKKNNYLYYKYDDYVILRNMCELLYCLLLCKKKKIINIYINILLNNNKYLNIINSVLIDYFINKIYYLNTLYYNNHKYLTIEKTNINIIKYLLINKNVYYDIQKKIIKNKYYEIMKNKYLIYLTYIDVLYN